MSNGPVIIVTGASRGVGYHTALSLANEHGRQVLAIARTAGALETLSAAAALGRGSVEPLVLDLAAPEAVDRIKAQLRDREVLGLVNNAGLLIKRSFGEWTVQDMARLFQVNMITPTMLVQGLRDRFAGGGEAHVVNISSMGGFQGSVKFPGLLAYSSSKAALANATECLAEELRPYAVACNCLCLGAVDTEMLREAFPGYEAPVGAEEVGRFVAQFLLTGHKLLNGKVLPISLSTP